MPAEGEELAKVKLNTCAITGHRPERFPFGRDESDPRCVRLKKAIRNAILTLAAGGVDRYICGMARGVDLWAARQILTIKKERPYLKLITVRPCATQADRWQNDEREEYNRIISEADESVCLHEKYTSFCMMERNRWMVNHAGAILAVFDGAPDGGTAYTVNYAAKKHLAVWILDTESLELTTQLKF